MRIHHSRKHGAFDSRYLPVAHKPAPERLWRLGEERLDWQGFLARFYPGRLRHDLDALAAYESYLNDAEGRPAGDSPAYVLSRNTTQQGEDEEEPLATPDTERWEGDGGAPAARPRWLDRESVSTGSTRVQSVGGHP